MHFELLQRCNEARVNTLMRHGYWINWPELSATVCVGQVRHADKAPLLVRATLAHCRATGVFDAEVLVRHPQWALCVLVVQLAFFKIDAVTPFRAFERAAKLAERTTNGYVKAG